MLNIQCSDIEYLYKATFVCNMNHILIAVQIAHLTKFFNISTNHVSLNVCPYKKVLKIQMYQICVENILNELVAQTMSLCIRVQQSLASGPDCPFESDFECTLKQADRTFGSNIEQNFILYPETQWSHLRENLTGLKRVKNLFQFNWSNWLLWSHTFLWKG